MLHLTPPLRPVVHHMQHRDSHLLTWRLERGWRLCSAPFAAQYDNQMAAVLHWALVPVPVVYDVTRRETFESLEEIWMREVDLYSTVDQAVKMVVANKVDKVSHSCLGKL